MRSLLRQQRFVCRRKLAKHVPHGFQFGGQRIEDGVLSLQVFKSAEQNGADLLLIKHNGTSLHLAFLGNPGIRRASLTPGSLNVLCSRPNEVFSRIYGNMESY